jgi:hypothetical protein
MVGESVFFRSLRFTLSFKEIIELSELILGRGGVAQR